MAYDDSVYTIVEDYIRWCKDNQSYRFDNPLADIPRLAKLIHSTITNGMSDLKIIIYATEFTIPCGKGGGAYHSGEFSEFEGVLRLLYDARYNNSDTSEMIRKSKLFCDTVREVYEKNKRVYKFF